jgi:hypothetical protein
MCLQARIQRQDRFPRPTCVFLDGDNDAAPGCHLLPGADAPEQVVFRELKQARSIEDALDQDSPAAQVTMKPT